MTYNQPAGLREALQASLDQDYPNLEIVISDDFSTDETFDIVQEVVEAYDGPHRVCVTRNPRNFGLVGNFNTAFEKTQGGLIVQTNGDDVARADRVSRLVESWRADPEARLVFSKARWVQFDGRVAGMLNERPESDYLAPAADYPMKRLFATGAVVAYDRRIFEKFGPIPSTATVEDHVMPFRARLIGRVCKVEDVLIDLRPGGTSWASDDPEERERARKRFHASRVGNRRAILRDVKGRGFPGKWRLVVYCRLFLLANALVQFPVGEAAWKTLARIDGRLRRLFAS